MTMLARTFGLAEPIRRGMELKLVRDADAVGRPRALGRPSGVHEDILTGRDTEIAWEDVYADQDGARAAMLTGGDGAFTGVHDEMEARIGMGKW